MRSNFRGGFVTGALCALILGMYLAWLWQPERQIQLHSAHFIAQIQNRNWAALPEFIGTDFRDTWGDDREQFLMRLREVSRYTRDLKITSLNSQVREHGGDGFWTAMIKVDGEEGEAMALIKERINSLGTPFALRWRRDSGKPWNWRLTAISNPDLQINDGH